MGGSSQVANLGFVSAIDLGVRQPGEDREVAAMLAQDRQIGREFVIAPSVLRKEVSRQNALVRLDREQPAWHRGFGLSS